MTWIFFKWIWIDSRLWFLLNITKISINNEVSSFALPSYSNTNTYDMVGLLSKLKENFSFSALNNDFRIYPICVRDGKLLVWRAPGYSLLNIYIFFIYELGHWIISLNISDHDLPWYLFVTILFSGIRFDACWFSFSSKSWPKHTRSLVTQRNVKSTINMARMPLRKAWVVEVVATTHLIFSNPSSVAVHLAVRILTSWDWASCNWVTFFGSHCSYNNPFFCLKVVGAAEAEGREGVRM